jgi:hypothetical protein
MMERMSYTDDLLAHAQEHTKDDTFKSAAAILVLAETYRDDNYLRDTFRALDGVCTLHLDTLWAEAVRTTPWWRRRAFSRGKAQWRQDKRLALIAEATRDIDSIRGKWGMPPLAIILDGEGAK